jgi:hypothetical protein
MAGVDSVVARAARRRPGHVRGEASGVAVARIGTRGSEKGRLRPTSRWHACRSRPATGCDELPDEVARELDQAITGQCQLSLLSFELDVNAAAVLGVRVRKPHKVCKNYEDCRVGQSPFKFMEYFQAAADPPR